MNTARSRDYTGTSDERHAAIYAGMAEILAATLKTHPHLRYALASQTPEIYAANYQLAAAVNRFTSGSLQLRRDVRPYFDRALAAYLKLADEIVLCLGAIVQQAITAAIMNYAELDAASESPEILTACAAFMAARNRLFRGAGNTAETARAFHEMIAAHLAAVTPADLPVEPLERAA